MTTRSVIGRSSKWDTIQRCAVCGFDVRLGTSQLGIDAAHIKWHQAGGPDVVPNAFALCVLHHKLFDRGVFSVDQGHRVIVSEQTHGGNGFELHLLGRRSRGRYPQRKQPQHPTVAWMRCCRQKARTIRACER